VTIDLHLLPSWPQSQDSLKSQTAELIQVANRLGLYDAATLLSQLSAPAPPPEPPPPPDLSALAAIGERLRTQDNRCTAHPAFQVRGLRRIYGMDPDYADDTVWLDDGIEVDPPDDPENPGDFFIKTGYRDHWEVIMVAFSEQACLDFIEHNGYRYGVYQELEVYADSFYRCPEMLAIREALMALPRESTSPSEPPTEEEIEEAAKLIHASMRFAVPDNHNTRDWVERGNSLMQDEARRTARAVLERRGHR